MDVSVVIACRNRERRIGTAIESALAQDVPPREVVVLAFDLRAHFGP